MLPYSFSETEMGERLPYLQNLGTASPTTAPTSPTTSPTAPSNSPTTSPTAAPSFSPSRSPSAAPSMSPSLSPSLAPTLTPSRAPSSAPSFSPTASPTLTPSFSPTFSPSAAPSVSPLSLLQVMAQNEEGEELERVSGYTLYIIVGVALFVVLTACAVMKKRDKKQSGKMSVDDQKYMNVIVYLVQMVDVLSDLIFAFQCKAYRDHLGDVDYEVAVEPVVFEWLYFLALIFVVGPYFLNLVSSVNITRKIAADDSITEHSKQYFRAKFKVYVILVLMSGGAFPALHMMSSNLFGLGLFSAGLSNIQIEHFRGHHVVTTVRSNRMCHPIIFCRDLLMTFRSCSRMDRNWRFNMCSCSRYVLYGNARESISESN